MGFEINFEELAKQINEKKPKTVLIQAPDGMKMQLIEVVKELEKRTNAEYLTLIEPAWGSCDLADEKAKKLNADLLIHFGHNMIYPGRIPTIFFPLTPKIDPQPLIEKLIKFLSKEKVLEIGLVSSSQFTPYLQQIKDYLEEKGFSVSIGKGSNRVKDFGQVLGCNYSSALDLDEDIEAIVYFGDGIFHPIGITFSSKKRVIIADPYTLEVKELKEERDKYLRKRFAIISQCSHAQKFGIIVSIKSGQLYLQTARKMKELIESKGKQAFILVCDFVYPQYFLGLDVDVLVNTACPRLAIENLQEFNKLMINPKELEIALNVRSLHDYQFEELI